MDLDAQFQLYHISNPRVYDLFKRFAYEALMQGFHRFGAKAIMERIRWHELIEKGRNDFVVNNNYTSRYVRMLMEEKPEFIGFFETRKMKSRGE